MRPSLIILATSALLACGSSADDNAGAAPTGVPSGDGGSVIDVGGDDGGISGDGAGTDGTGTDGGAPDGGVPDGGEPAPLSDFALVDANGTSPTSGEPVSPRDFLGKVSGWYFTHAT